MAGVESIDGEKGDEAGRGKQKPSCEEPWLDLIDYEYREEIMVRSLVSVQPGDTSKTWSELHFRKMALDLRGAVKNVLN